MWPQWALSNLHEPIVPDREVLPSAIHMHVHTVRQSKAMHARVLYHRHGGFQRMRGEHAKPSGLDYI